MQRQDFVRTTTLRLNEEDNNKLKELAQKRDLPEAEVLRQLIRNAR